MDAFLLAVGYWIVAGNGGEQEKEGRKELFKRELDFLDKIIPLALPFPLQRQQPPGSPLLAGQSQDQVGLRQR